MAVPASTGVVSSALSTVTGAIRNAAQATGTSFNYLLATAQVESRLNPSAAAPTSSAVGLFQFIEQTWLGMIKQAGPDHGYGRYADAIQRTADGRCYVPDSAMRAEIMKLRFDPAANAAMAGAFTNDNAGFLANRIGRKPTDGELYIAHFFGPSAACRLITMAAEDPRRDGAAQFPAAARANRSVFFDRQGNARSVSQVYGELVRRYRVALEKATGTADVASVAAAAQPAFTAVPTPVARPASALAPVGPAHAVSPTAVRGVAAGEQTSPTAHIIVTPTSATRALVAGDSRDEPVAVMEALATTAPAPRPLQRDALFNDLYRPGPRETALAPVVDQLWGTPAPTTKRAPQTIAVAPRSAPAIGRQPETFELFRDAILPNLRAMFAKSA